MVSMVATLALLVAILHLLPSWSRDGLVRSGGAIPDLMPVYCDLGVQQGWTYGKVVRENSIEVTQDGWYVLGTVGPDEPAVEWLRPSRAIEILVEYVHPHAPHMRDERLSVIAPEKRTATAGGELLSTTLMMNAGDKYRIEQYTLPGRVRPMRMWFTPDYGPAIFGLFVYGACFLVFAIPISSCVGAVGACRSLRIRQSHAKAA